MFTCRKVETKIREENREAEKKLKRRENLHLWILQVNLPAKQSAQTYANYFAHILS